jgi:HlyD family secretion protein
MKLQHFVPMILVVGGAIVTVMAVKATTEPTPATATQTLPPAPASPFQRLIAGTGIVEPQSESIQISTDIAGVVIEVPISPGDRVKQGTVLFRLDDRDASARLQTAQARLASARQRLTRLACLPRAETLPPLKAAVEEARSELESARNDATRFRSASDVRAVASLEVERQEFAARTFEARLTKAQAELDAALAGTWEPDLELADIDVRIEEARLKEIETELARLTIRAPIDGQILERNVRVGQFAESRNAAESLIVMGNTDVLHVRVDIDETESWRFVEGARAVGMVRGNPTLKANLTFVRAEPSVLPKRSLTGASTERTDTRVLRVLYAITPGTLPVRVGQLLDVRIEAPSSEPSRDPAS